MYKWYPKSLYHADEVASTASTNEKKITKEFIYNVVRLQ